MSRPLENLAFGATIAALVAAAVAIQIVRDTRFPAPPVESRMLYVTSGTVARRLALSYDSLLADVYWIRAIQHYGGDRLSDLSSARRYDLLYPLLDLTTSLDPRFKIAYRFGAIFLMEPYPGGAGRPDLAIRLLEKGIDQTPERWEYYLDIGFVYYWRLSEYTKAAEWFERGGNLPGAPWWLRTYAAVMLAKGGDRASSRFLWRNIYDTTDDEWLKNTARMRLAQLDALDQIDQLGALVAEFERRAGGLPARWADLVAAGLLTGTPVDPSGEPYQLNASTGAVTVSASSDLYPLPVEPTNSAAPARPGPGAAANG